MKGPATRELHDLGHKGRRIPEKNAVKQLFRRDEYLQIPGCHSQGLAGILHHRTERRGLHPHEKAQRDHPFIAQYSGRDSCTIVHLDHFGNDPANGEVDMRILATIEQYFPGVNGNEFQTCSEAPVTDTFAAEVLGVRPMRITSAAQNLEKEALIRYGTRVAGSRFSTETGSKRVRVNVIAMLQACTTHYSNAFRIDAISMSLG